MKTFANILGIIILFLIILSMVFSCSPLTKQQKSENKMARKLERLKAKNPEAFKNVTTEVIRIDTVIKEVRVEGELRIDTLETEKLVKEFIRDTVRVTEFITRFLETTRDSVAIDTLGVHLRLAGTNIDYSLKRDSIHIEKEQAVETITITNTEVVRKSFFQDWKFWLLVVLIVVGYLMRSIIAATYNKHKPW